MSTFSDFSAMPTTHLLQELANYHLETHGGRPDLLKRAQEAVKWLEPINIGEMHSNEAWHAINSTIKSLRVICKRAIDGIRDWRNILDMTHHQPSRVAPGYYISPLHLQAARKNLTQFRVALARNKAILLKLEFRSRLFFHPSLPSCWMRHIFRFLDGQTSRQAACVNPDWRRTVGSVTQGQT